MSTWKAAAFAALALAELAKFSGSRLVAAAVGGLITVGLLVYILRAFREVYRYGWPRTLASAVGIGLIYLATAIPAFILVLTWAAVT